jgi:hypothetical protein
MLSGFNANIRHRGVLFHVQTEDSGRAHPHVITHLFHGGNILASEKRSYEALLQEGDLPARVKRLMEEQHGDMVRKLQAGALDDVIRERLGDGALASGPDGEDGPEAVRRIDPEASGAPAARVASEPAPDRPTAPSDAARPRADAPPPPGGAERQPPLDEVVQDYLVEAARRRSNR